MHQGHDLLQHIAVFWVGPLSGALAAGLVWQLLTSPPSAKPKKKRAAAPKAKQASTPKQAVPAGKQAKKTQ
jgi:hypothetical protein